MDGAGQIWYAALTSGIGPDTDFAGFAAATVRAAQAVSEATAELVRAAWGQVGVTAAATTPRRQGRGRAQGRHPPGR